MRSEAIPNRLRSRGIDGTGRSWIASFPRRTDSIDRMGIRVVYQSNHLSIRKIVVCDWIHYGIDGRNSEIRVQGNVTTSTRRSRATTPSGKHIPPGSGRGHQMNRDIIVVGTRERSSAIALTVVVRRGDCDRHSTTRVRRIHCQSSGNWLWDRERYRQGAAVSCPSRDHEVISHSSRDWHCEERSKICSTIIVTAHLSKVPWIA